jgi:hypothetical protein
VRESEWENLKSRKIHVWGESTPRGVEHFDAQPARVSNSNIAPTVPDISAICSIDDEINDIVNGIENNLGTYRADGLYFFSLILNFFWCS